MAKVCPKCGAREFIVSPHVVQDWLVDENGNFIEERQSCVQVVHSVDNDDIWTCACCGYDDAGYMFDENAQPAGVQVIVNEKPIVIYDRIVVVDPTVLASIDGYLHANRKSQYQSEDDVIVYTAKFPDGCQMDVECCGSQTESSWTQAVLYDKNGCQLSCTPPKDEYLGGWSVTHGDHIYNVKIMPARVIDTDLLSRAYDARLLRLTMSPNDDGVVAHIGSDWFYFGGHEAEQAESVREYKKNISRETILRDILNVLDDFRITGDEFADEYIYCACYLTERLPRRQHQETT